MPVLMLQRPRKNSRTVAAFILLGAAMLLPLWLAVALLAQGVQPLAVAQQPPPSAQAPVPPQSPASRVPDVDSDPVRSPDPEGAATPLIAEPNAEPNTPSDRTNSASDSSGIIQKDASGGYVLRADVEEVVLNVTVLEGTRPVPDLKKENFRILEDGVAQRLVSFQHVDVPVSIALLVDNSGSMSRKRPAVNKSTLDLIAASNPDDEAFVVNFADEAFIDQDFTSDVVKLREGLAHMDARGGTALFDAVVASADKLATDAKRPKQVIVLITDGEDNASTLNLEQAIRRVQQLSGPVIYTIGLLFGDEMSHGEVRHARHALEMLSNETGGIAFFPKSIEQIDQIAAEVARDIRAQYTLGYHSTKPSSESGFRRVMVEARTGIRNKLTVRTRTGYFPGPASNSPAKP